MPIHICVDSRTLEVDGGVDEGPEEGDADGAEGLDGAVGEPPCLVCGVIMCKSLVGGVIWLVGKKYPV